MLHPRKGVSFIEVVDHELVRILSSMALPQLKQQFEAARKLLPEQTTGWPGVSTTDLKDSYPSNANISSDLQAFLYGTNDSGFLPRLQKSWEPNVARLEEILTKSMKTFISATWADNHQRKLCRERRMVSLSWRRFRTQTKRPTPRR